MDSHCFDADLETDPDPAQNLDADPDPDRGGREGVGQPKMCIPPGKILGTPLPVPYRYLQKMYFRKNNDLLTIRGSIASTNKSTSRSSITLDDVGSPGFPQITPLKSLILGWAAGEETVSPKSVVHLLRLLWLTPLLISVKNSFKREL